MVAVFKLRNQLTYWSLLHMSVEKKFEKEKLEIFSKFFVCLWVIIWATIASQKASYQRCCSNCASEYQVTFLEAP